MLSCVIECISSDFTATFTVSNTWQSICLPQNAVLFSQCLFSATKYIVFIQNNTGIYIQIFILSWHCCHSFNFPRKATRICYGKIFAFGVIQYTWYKIYNIKTLRSEVSPTIDTKYTTYKHCGVKSHFWSIQNIQHTTITEWSLTSDRYEIYNIQPLRSEILTSDRYKIYNIEPLWSEILPPITQKQKWGVYI